MHRGLFVDFNGTICFDHFWRSADVAVQQAAKSLLFSEDDALIKQWMTGAYTAEQISDMVADFAGMNTETVWDAFVSDCRTMTIRQSLLDDLLKAAKTHQIILITDNMDSFNRFTVPALGLGKYFHHIANSYDYGLLKNQQDGLFFNRVAHECGVDIAQSILLDDSVDACQMFVKCGGAAHQVKTPDCVENFIGQLLRR